MNNERWRQVPLLRSSLAVIGRWLRPTERERVSFELYVHAHTVHIPLIGSALVIYRCICLQQADMRALVWL